MHKLEETSKGLEEVKREQVTHTTQIASQSLQITSMEGDMIAVKATQVELAMTAQVLKEELQADRLMAQAEAKADREAAKAEREAADSRMLMGLGQVQRLPPMTYAVPHHEEPQEEVRISVSSQATEAMDLQEESKPDPPTAIKVAGNKKQAVLGTASSGEEPRVTRSAQVQYPQRFTELTGKR